MPRRKDLKPGEFIDDKEQKKVIIHDDFQDEGDDSDVINNEINHGGAAGAQSLSQQLVAELKALVKQQAQADAEAQRLQREMAARRDAMYRVAKAIQAEYERENVAEVDILKEFIEAKQLEGAAGLADQVEIRKQEKRLDQQREAERKALEARVRAIQQHQAAEGQRFEAMLHQAIVPPPQAPQAAASSVSEYGVKSLAMHEHLHERSHIRIAGRRTIIITSAKPLAKLSQEAVIACVGQGGPRHADREVLVLDKNNPEVKQHLAQFRSAAQAHIPQDMGTSYWNKLMQEANRPFGPTTSAPNDWQMAAIIAQAPDVRAEFTGDRTAKAVGIEHFLKHGGVCRHRAMWLAYALNEFTDKNIDVYYTRGYFNNGFLRGGHGWVVVKDNTRNRAWLLDPMHDRALELTNPQEYQQIHNVYQFDFARICGIDVAAPAAAAAAAGMQL